MYAKSLPKSEPAPQSDGSPESFTVNSLDPDTTYHFALKTADAQRMVQAAKAADRMLMIAHVLPFVPEYSFAYKAVTSGKYGRPLGGNFKRVTSDPLWLDGFYDPQICGGPMIDLHIHDAHFIRLLFGVPRGVQSVGRMRGEVAEYFNTQFLR